MHGPLAELFINLDLYSALQVVALGFIGGILSGFIGSGGAFFMTPGMMNLGVQGVVAVASNITHKFGKAMVGSHKHGEMGNVDKKLALFLLVTAAAGTRLAVWLSSLLFESGEAHGADKGARANLYISLVFVGILTAVAISMLKDVLSKRSDGGAGPSRKIAEKLAQLNLKPLIYFKVADVHVSLWVLLLVGLATGYLAGTIGVGGFIGVPAMIYVFGIPTAVAAGTELYLAMFMGAFGAAQLCLRRLRGPAPGPCCALPGFAGGRAPGGLRRQGRQREGHPLGHRRHHHPVRVQPGRGYPRLPAPDGDDQPGRRVGRLVQRRQQGNVLKAYRQRRRLKRSIAYSRQPAQQH